MFYLNFNNQPTIKGQQKAYDYARLALPFLYYTLNAQLNSQYNGLYSEPVNRGSGRFCNAQFTLYANCIDEPERNYGKFVCPATYKQKQYSLAVETYMNGDNFISIRSERLSNLMRLTLHKEGILLLGNSYFSLDNSWMNNQNYYEDYDRTWNSHDIEITRKDGTKAIWHIRPHKNSYRKFNLLKLEKDGLIYKFSSNEICAYLNYNKIDISGYREPDLHIKEVQWDFKKSQPLFYWKAFKKEDNKDGQILDRLNTAHEIYSIFTRDKKIKKTEAELKKDIYNKVRSKNARAINIVYEDNTIVELYVSDEKDHAIKAAFDKKSYQRNYMSKCRDNKAKINNNPTADLTSDTEAQRASVLKREVLDKFEYINVNSNKDCLFGNTQFSLTSLKTTQAAPETTEVRAATELDKATNWYNSIKDNIQYKYIISRIENDEDILFYYNQIKRK